MKTRSKIGAVLLSVLMLFSVLVFVISGTESESETSSSPYEYVVVIGVDGMGNLQVDTETPNLDAIFANGATTGTALVENPSASAQGWGSILTGAKCTDHGMTNYTIQEGAYSSDTYPTIFKMISDAKPDAKLVSYCCWNSINNGIIEEIDGVVKEKVADANMGSAVANYFSANGAPNLLFCQFNVSDAVGHASGYGSPEHLQCLTDTDSYIGDVYNVYKDAGILDKTLFIVTTDHGGTLDVAADGTTTGTHGGWSDREKYVFYGIAGEGVNKMSLPDMYIRDTAAIVCYALGVKGNEIWDSYVPAGVFADNMTPLARPASAPELVYPNGTPAADSEKYLGNYIDVDELRAGFFFDGDLSNFVEGSDVELNRYVGDINSAALGTVYYPTGLYGNGVRVSYEGYLATDDLKFDTGSFSISLWLKADEMISDQPVWSTKVWSTVDEISGSDQQGLIIRNYPKNDNTYLGVSFGSGAYSIDGVAQTPTHANYNYDAKNQYNANEWVHTLVVIDRDAGVFRYYVNFELAKTMNLSSYAWFTDDYDIDPYDIFSLGQDVLGTYKRSYEGSFDDLLIWNKAIDLDGDTTVAGLKSYYEDAIYDYGYSLGGAPSVSATGTTEVTVTDGATNTDSTEYKQLAATVLGEALTETATYRISNSFTLADYTNPRFYIVDFDISTASDYLPMNFVSLISGSAGTGELEAAYNRITSGGVLVGSVNGNEVTRTLSTSPYDWQHITMVYDLVGGDDGYPLYIYYNGDLISNAEWIKASAKESGELPAAISGTSLMIESYATSADHYATTLIANATSALYTDDTYGNLDAFFASGASMREANAIFDLNYGAAYTLPEADNMFMSAEVGYRAFADAVANGDGTVDLLHNDYYNTYSVSTPCTVNTNGYAFNYEYTDAVRLTEDTDSSGNAVYKFLSNTPLYTITAPDGTVTNIYDETSLGNIINNMVATGTEAATTIKLFADILVDDTTVIVTNKYVNLDLNGWTLSNSNETSDARIRPNGGIINIYGGNIVDTAKTDILFGTGASSVVTVTDCELSGCKFMDVRQGSYTFVNCTFKQSGSTDQRFAIMGSASTDENLTLTLEDCNFDLGSSYLVGTTRGASYTAAAYINVKIIDSTVTTTGKLFDITNAVSADLSTTNLTVDGSKTRISCSSIDNTSTENKPNTFTLTLGLGAMFSVEPTIVGTVSYSGDASGVKKTDTDADYPYEVVGDDYLYTVTAPDGTETKYYEEMSLQALLTLTEELDGSTVTLYTDVDLSDTTAYNLFHKVSINLNGYSVTNTGERLRLYNNGHLIMYGGAVNDTAAKDFIFIGAGVTGAVVEIDDCDMIGNGYILDARAGSITVTNSTYTQGADKAGQFCYLLSAGDSASLTVENCTIDTGSSQFVKIKRGASYTTAASATVTVTDSIISASGALFDLTNDASAALSSNAITIKGNSKITCTSIDNGTNTVENTVLTLGLGVKFSVMPTLTVGTLTYCDGAKAVAETGDTDYPYEVIDGTLLYTLTLSDGTEKKYYSEKYFVELVAIADSGSTITLYSDIVMNEAGVEYTIASKNINLNLNGNSISSASRTRLTGTAQFYIYGGTVTDGSVDFIFIAKNNNSTVFKIEDCDVNITGRLVDMRAGSIQLIDSTVTNNSGGSFNLGSDGTAVSFSADNCTFNLGTANLVSTSRTSYTDAVTLSISLNNCKVTTTAALFNLKNTASPDTSETRISITGNETRLSYDSFDGNSCTVSDTVVSLGLGVKMNKRPTIALGSIEFTDGAKGINKTDDAEYPYETSDTVLIPFKPYFSLTLYVDFTLNLCVRADEAEMITKVEVDGEEITSYTEDGMVFYPIKGIAAHNAADAKNISVSYSEDGISSTAVLTYSVIDYANGLLSSDYSTESKELIARTLEYIEAAYEYVGIEIPESVTTLMASEKYISVSNSENVSVIPESSTNVGDIKTILSSAQINITSDLRFRFNIREGANTTLSVKSASVDETYVIENGLCGGKSYIEVPIRALDMYNGVITFTSGDIVGTYDLKAYANSDSLTEEERTAIAPFMLALYNYCREANEYAVVSDKDFKPFASVVVKDGKEGTVTFVLDDGKTDTSDIAVEMLPDYEELKLTFAIIPKALATLHTEINVETGKYEYVFDENGKYTYTLNENNVEYWRSILEAGDGRFEIISHTMTHSFWGIDDNGGIFTYVNADGEVITSAELPAGSVTAEIYAAAQILEDVFGIEASTVVLPGIGVGQADVEKDGVTYKSPYHAFFEVVDRAYADGTLIGMRGAGFAAVNVTPDCVITPEYLATVSNRVAVEAMTVKNYNDVSLWKDYIDYARAVGGWAPYCLHRIVPDGEETSDLNIYLSQAEELFGYAESQNVWIANYTEATKYYTEWSTANVEVSYENGKLTVNLTDGENDELFDEALTVKVSVPTSWSECSVNGEALEINTAANGESFVYVNIVPDSGVVEIVGN